MPSVPEVNDPCKCLEWSELKWKEAKAEKLVCSVQWQFAAKCLVSEKLC